MFQYGWTPETFPTNEAPTLLYKASTKSTSDFPRTRSNNTDLITEKSILSGVIATCVQRCPNGWRVCPARDLKNDTDVPQSGYS